MNLITCPKCGTECDKLLNSVCRDCFFENFRLIELPLVLHIRICSRCGAHFHKNRWEDAGNLEEIVRKTVEEALFIHEKAEDIELYIEPRGLTPYISRVHVEVDTSVEGEPVHAEAETEVRVKREACDMCSRSAGGYYEAVIQVRAKGRLPTEGERRRCIAIAREAMRQMKKKGDRLAFITDQQETKEGLDFLMGSINASRHVCKLISAELGGSFSESPTLVGMKDGKNLYRITYSMRLPEFRPGDIIYFKDRVIEVKSSGKRILGLDLRDASRFVADADDLKDAKRIANIEDAVTTVLVSIEENAILVLDPDTYETVAINKPISFSAEAGSDIKILKTPYGLFALSDSGIARENT